MNQKRRKALASISEQVNQLSSDLEQLLEELNRDADETLLELENDPENTGEDAIEASVRLSGIRQRWNDLNELIERLQGISVSYDGSVS